jgi:hypothetical protein
VLKKTFSAQYLYAVKDISSCTASLYFTISPDDPSLYLMNFANLIQTTIPYSTIQASYSAGLLVVSLAYTQTIEDTNQTVNISIDPAYLYSPSMQLAISPSGVNYALVFNSTDNFNSIILLLSAVIGGLALVFAIVSSVLGYKLIGFEIMLPIQLMYLSLSELNHTSSALGSLKNLSFSTGYNQIASFTLTNSMSVQPGLQVMQRTSEFLTNVNFSAAPLLVVITIALIFRLGIKEKEKKAEVVKTDKKGKQKGKDKLEE